MIIFLYGPDEYRLRRRADELIERYRAKYSSGVNLARINVLERTGGEQLADALKSASFFEEVKLLIVQNAFANKNVAEAVLTTFQEQDILARRDTVVMIIAPRALSELKTTHKGLAVLAAKGTTVESFDLLADVELARWLTGQTKALGCTLTADGQRELITRAGPATWPLALELQKLANYCGQRAITAHDVRHLVASADTSSIFNLTDAFGQRQSSQAVVLLYQHLAAGQDPYYILTMLTYHVRNLLALKAADGNAGAGQKLGIHPFAARKAAQQARQFTPEELCGLFTRLVALEQETKQGAVTLVDELYAVATGLSYKNFVV